MSEMHTESTCANPKATSTGAGIDENLKPKLMPDGTHRYPLVNVSIPIHGISGNGKGEVIWHPEKGIEFHIEALSPEKYSCLEAALVNHMRPTASSSMAGSVIEPSREAQLVGQVAGTGETIYVYQLEANVKKQSQLSTAAGVSVSLIVTGKAIAATVRIERESVLSYWHESLGTCRLLIPDLFMFQWPIQDYVQWKDGDTSCKTLRSSCELSVTPLLSLFNASILPKERKACWLTFEPNLIPDGEIAWHIPDVCLAANSLLSFLCGKRLPILLLDRLSEESHLNRTYIGTATVDDFPTISQGYQPAPFISINYGGMVIAELPSLFRNYLELRRWFDLDWIIGPLWYALSAYVEDNLGLASVSLERYATALDAYEVDHPEQKRTKIKFLTKAQSKLLRQELSNAVAGFAKQRGIDLTQSRLPSVVTILDKAVETIAQSEDMIFPEDALTDLRIKMKEAIKIADVAGKLKLDETQSSIIDKRITTFAQKTNPDKLIEALEFDGLSVNDKELEAVMKRNDCLHGRRTLKDASSLREVEIEIAQFDTLRTLINKVMLARLGYRGLYIDYGQRPPQKQFPVRALADEITTTPIED